MTPKEHLEALDTHIEMTAITEGVYNDLKKQHIIPLREAIERVKKVEELLKLYREHKYLVPFKTGLGEKSKRVHDIHKQIQALEEELK